MSENSSGVKVGKKWILIHFLNASYRTYGERFIHAYVLFFTSLTSDFLIKISRSSGENTKFFPSDVPDFSNHLICLNQFFATLFKAFFGRLTAGLLLLTKRKN